MSKITLVFAMVLILLGVGFYLGTGMQQPTSLIPAMAGVLFAICGLAALKETRRKHAMHLAVALAVLALFGTAMGIVNTIKHLTGGYVEHPPAALEKSITAILCLAYVGLSLRSFLAARRSRAAEQGR